MKAGALAALAAPLSAVAAFAQDAAAPAAEAVAAAAPVVNKGDTTWMLVSTILVIMMTIPGLALFYGGLVRAKNMLSVLMQVFAGFAIIALLWVIYGYTLAFVGAGSAADATALTPFIGNLSKMFLERRRAGVGGGDLLQGRLHPGTDLRHLPADLRRHHPGADRRRGGRAHALRLAHGLHRAVVHLRLPADRAHGLVVGRPERG